MFVLNEAISLYDFWELSKVGSERVDSLKVFLVWYWETAIYSWYRDLAAECYLNKNVIGPHFGHVG